MLRSRFWTFEKDGRYHCQRRDWTMADTEGAVLVTPPEGLASRADLLATIRALRVGDFAAAPVEGVITTADIAP